MDYTVHGILQARILEWVAIPFSRRSSQPRDQTQVSCIAGGVLTCKLYEIYIQMKYEGRATVQISVIIWEQRSLTLESEHLKCKSQL